MFLLFLPLTRTSCSPPKEKKKAHALTISVRRSEHANMQMNTEAFEVVLWRVVTPRLGLSAALPINKTLLRAGCAIRLSSQERQRDNYHHGISQPSSISCYFWAIPFEVSLCFIWLSLNTAGLLGRARQLSSLTVGLPGDADCLSCRLRCLRC